jgi:MFS family permease
VANDSADRPLITLPPGIHGLTAFALALGTFMQVLDTTIANVSLPTIAGSLGVSPNQGTWVITSFAVANGISASSCSRWHRSCAAWHGASNR